MPLPEATACSFSARRTEGEGHSCGEEEEEREEKEERKGVGKRAHMHNERHGCQSVRYVCDGSKSLKYKGVDTEVSAFTSKNSMLVPTLPAEPPETAA